MFFNKMRKAITEYQCAMHKLANQVCSLREEIDDLKTEIKMHRASMQNLENKIEVNDDIYNQLEDVMTQMKSNSVRFITNEKKTKSKE